MGFKMDSTTETDYSNFYENLMALADHDDHKYFKPDDIKAAFNSVVTVFFEELQLGTLFR